MKIGELARATGTKAETIRYYEREGILPAADRTDANYRDYSPGHLATLTFVRRARELGFSMVQVRTLLALSDSADQSCEAVDLLVQRQIEDIAQRIADLTCMKLELGRMLDACHGGSIGECHIVESLGQSTATAPGR